MKKLLIAILIIGIVGGLSYYFWLRNSGTDTDIINPEPQGDGETRPNPSNAIFIIDGESITLSNGVNEMPVAPNSALVEETSLLDEYLAYSDLNNDDKNDTALLLSSFGGGSGTFLYVAAYVSGPINYKGTNAIYLGDRIAPQEISIDGGIITVEYLDRSEDDPFTAEPTVRKTEQFVFRNGQLVER